MAQRERGLVWIAFDKGAGEAKDIQPIAETLDRTTREVVSLWGTGFLVTRPSGRPVAWVRFADAAGYAKAVKIADDYAAAAEIEENGGRDLRACTVKAGGKQYPTWFWRLFVAQMDRAGKVLHGKYGWTCGEYGTITERGKSRLGMAESCSAFLADDDRILAAFSPWLREKPFQDPTVRRTAAAARIAVRGMATVTFEKGVSISEALEALEAMRYALLARWPELVEPKFQNQDAEQTETAVKVAQELVGNRAMASTAA